MNYIDKLICITNEDIPSQPPLSSREIRDNLIEQIFPDLNISEKFRLATLLERAHMERRLEQRYPGKFTPEQKDMVVDQLIRALNEKEMLKKQGERTMPFSNSNIPK